MKYIFKFILNIFWGRKPLQGLYKALHFFALKGMNYGGGADFQTSGEIFVLQYIRQKLLPNERKVVIIDAGANVGNYALAADKVFSGLRERGVIFSFEPSSTAFEKLRANVAGRRIEPVNMALGERVQTAELHFTEGNSELSSLYDRQLSHFGLSLNKKQEIHITTLDGFCKEKNIVEVDFLKLDVEGHELLALRGASELIKLKKIRFIQFEFGGANLDSRTYLKDFFNLLGRDYNISRVLKNGFYLLEQYSEWDEVFVTSNFFAELKNYA